MNILVRVIQDSISEEDNTRLTTLELEYPRFIHGELMTHRVFSRNAASSRAIPISKMMEQVKENPASPIHWGANQKGMQADGEIENVGLAKSVWLEAAKSAAESAKMLEGVGLHKQIVNRVLEPFQTMKTIVSSTEWTNFFALRTHKDALPEFRCLATLVETAMNTSKPFVVGEGEWHVPYVERYRCPEYGNLIYHLSDDNLTDLTEEQAVKVSASCCAQVSYRMLDDTLEKAEMIYDRLVTSDPIHASPFEHQGTPSTGWHGNFKDWMQNRQLIEARAHESIVQK